MAVLFFLVFHWVVLTRAVGICNQCKDLPTISTVHLLLSLRDYCPVLLCQINHFEFEFPRNSYMVSHGFYLEEKNPLCVLDLILGSSSFDGWVVCHGVVGVDVKSGSVNSLRPGDAKICVGKLGLHWLWKLPNAYSALSHYLNQCWFIVDWTIGKKSMTVTQNS